MANIYQAPRLQLGDAPLTGYAGSQRDQFALVWQTTGQLTDDTFEVEYRAAGSNQWRSAPRSTPIVTGVGSRVNHTVTVTGLNYDTPYQYRVQHFRAGKLVESYQEGFKTRLAAGSTDEFTFAAYGDAAKPAFIKGFRAVQARINQVNPAFSLLLGDNAYDDGSHADYDYRFVTSLVPEAIDNITQRIDYSAIGNHDIDADDGLTYRQSYELPIPEAGVDSPAAPRGSKDEYNYSFDYGNTHFVTFDSNTLESAAELDNLLTYVEADLAASKAQWKIVFAHHPVAGAPNKSESPSDNYFRQVVPRLKQAGVDLLLTGHSHTYSWSYPLTGFAGDNATFVEDTDKVYDKGVGLVQAVVGTGGARLRTGSFDDYPFIVNGYSLSTSRQSEDGFAQISVSPDSLTVDYVAADDGEIIDSFQIVDKGDRGGSNPPINSPVGDVIFSLASNASIAGNAYRKEDLIAYDGQTFSKLFDGSDVGLKRLNIDAVDRISDTEFLMSFSAPTTLQMGSRSLAVDDSDIVKFTATSLGEDTSGRFSMYFDGSDVDLSMNSEDVNALALLENGDLLLSTTGNAKVGAIAAKDEDLLRFRPSKLGRHTKGDWQVYFDGSDVGLSAQADDIDAIGLSQSDLVLSTARSNTFARRSESVLQFGASSLGTDTAGTFDNQLIFNSTRLGLKADLINALDIVSG